MNLIDSFLAECETAKSIEIVSDFLLPEQSSFHSEENQVAISKSFYKVLLKFIVDNIETDPKKASLIGVITGSYDSRIWIIRKKLISNLRDIDSLQKELNLIHIGLAAVPKCAGAFENTRYILGICLSLRDNLSISDDKMVSIIQNEREFYSFLTGKILRNALLWRHRVWFTQFFNTEDEDLKWAENWVKLHPSDSSAFYFMETFIQKKLSSNIQTNISNTNNENHEYDLIKALQENTKALFVMPGHESIWNHRRFLLQNLIPKLKIPSNWRPSQSPNDQFDYPIVTSNNAIKLNYIKICDKFGIDLNTIISRTNKDDDSCELNLENEDLIVSVSRGDRFPSEYQKQRVSAEKHYRWLRIRFMKLF